jgi:multidrug efflux pump subunit AcrB
MVLFAMVMGLGMLVDDGIVVVDNVYANMEKGLSRSQASKFGIGEIAFPVITSTLTTLVICANVTLARNYGSIYEIFPYYDFGYALCFFICSNDYQRFYDGRKYDSARRKPYHRNQ